MGNENMDTRRLRVSLLSAHAPHRTPGTCAGVLGRGAPGLRVQKMLTWLAWLVGHGLSGCSMQRVHLAGLLRADARPQLWFCSGAGHGEPGAAVLAPPRLTPTSSLPRPLPRAGPLQTMGLSRRTGQRWHESLGLSYSAPSRGHCPPLPLRGPALLPDPRDPSDPKMCETRRDSACE